MVDGQMGNRVGRRQPDIDRHATASVRLEAQAAPAQHAAAGRAEADLQRRILLAGAGIGDGRPGEADAFTFVVVRPQRAIAAAERAVAGRDRTGIAVQRPLRRAAMTGTCKHACRLSFSLAPRQRLGQPHDRLHRRLERRLLRSKRRAGIEPHRRPGARILDVAAEFLEAETAVRPAEKIDAAIVLGVLDAVEHQPGFVDASGNRRSPARASARTALV